MSLSRLWQRQGKGDDARQLLVEVYDGFMPLVQGRKHMTYALCREILHPRLWVGCRS